MYCAQFRVRRSSHVTSLTWGPIRARDILCPTIAQHRLGFDMAAIRLLFLCFVLPNNDALTALSSSSVMSTAPARFVSAVLHNDSCAPGVIHPNNIQEELHAEGLLK